MSSSLLNYTYHNVILWNGFCITHKKANKECILFIKNKIADIKILVHPECESQIRSLADFIGSTMTCVNMKKTTVRNVYESLLYMKNEIVLDEDVRNKAHAALMNMHSMSM